MLLPGKRAGGGIAKENMLGNSGKGVCLLSYGDGFVGMYMSSRLIQLYSVICAVCGMSSIPQ